MAKEIKTVSYSASTKIVYPQSYNFADCGSLGWGEGLEERKQEIEEFKKKKKRKGQVCSLGRKMSRL